MKTSAIKPPILLKTILDILFWVLIFIFVSSIPFSILPFFTDIPLEVNNYKIEKITFWIFLAIFLSFLNSALFIYIVFLLRKVVRNFFKRKLFTPIQIAGLKLIGQLVIFTSLLEIAINFMLSLNVKGRAKFGISVESSYDSLWFTLALGLFFILLSQSFSYAKILQEENDLTV